MLQEIVSAGKVCESRSLFPQTVIHGHTVISNGSHGQARALLAGTSPLHQVVSVLSGEHLSNATLHRTHRLLSNDDRDHVPLCQLLVECASTIDNNRPLYGSPVVPPV